MLARPEGFEPPFAAPATVTCFVGKLGYGRMGDMARMGGLEPLITLLERQALYSN